MINESLYVLVDDDSLNNLISSATIKRVLDQPNIKDFVDPVEGVNYIKKITPSETSQVVLFLDINMPVMSGWDVLQELEKLEKSTKSKVKVFMLSSSVYREDKEKAYSHSLVVEYIEKPLNIEKFAALRPKIEYRGLN